MRDALKRRLAVLERNASSTGMTNDQVVAGVREAIRRVYPPEEWEEFEARCERASSEPRGPLSPEETGALVVFYLPEPACGPITLEKIKAHPVLSKIFVPGRMKSDRHLRELYAQAEQAADRADSDGHGGQI